MKNAITNTETGIYSPIKTSKERRFINHTGIAISFTPPNGIRSHFIHSPEKYAELCESENIKSEDVDKVVYNNFEFENTVDNEGN